MYQRCGGLAGARPLAGRAPALRRGVAEDRRISVEDGQMRHGRKSRSELFDGYKRAPMLPGGQRPAAGGVYQRCGGLAGARLLAGCAGCALDGPLGDSVPPVLPLLGGAGQVAGVGEPVPAERAAAVLPGWPLVAPDALVGQAPFAV